MNARELIQNLKSQIDMESAIAEKDVKVDVIGTSREAKAQITYWVEGKLKLIELTAREMPLVE